MPHLPFAPAAPSRRRFLAGLASLAAVPALAQGPRGPAGKPITVAQLVDTSQAEQDVAKDFLIGARAAWQDINAAGGIRGRPVQHATVEVDGSANAVRAALRQLQATSGCVVLSGSASDPVAALAVQ